MSEQAFVSGRTGPRNRDSGACADLHTHSLASDGTHPPSDIVRMAKDAGLAAVAITDHDTVDGIAEALGAGRETGVEVVPGVEISASSGGQDIHVLGYFIDISDPKLLARLSEQRRVRERRNELMVARLRELGVDISLEEVEEAARRSGKEGGNIGRPHIAEVLVAKGYASSPADAFDRWIGKHGKAYVTPPRIRPEEAIDWIREAGGAAVLAHPGLYGDEALVERLIAYGLDGIEAYHSDHTPEQEAHYAALVGRHGLAATAGSDFHGRSGETVFHGPVGNRRAAYGIVEQLKERTTRPR